jgi:hypothetical protein
VRELPRFSPGQQSRLSGLPLILTEFLSLERFGKQASEIRPHAKHPAVDLTNQTGFRSAQFSPDRITPGFQLSCKRFDGAHFWFGGSFWFDYKAHWYNAGLGDMVRLF